MNELERDLEINLDELHKNWKEHSTLRYKYACEVSHLDRVLKKIGEGIAAIRADSIKKCKEDNPKATVQQIEAFCIENVDHIEAKGAQLEAEYELNMAKNAVRAFDDRKNALENEVKLWGGNYFSSPVEDFESEKDPDTISIETKINAETSQKTRRRMNKNKK